MRAGNEFYPGIQPAMFVAPISDKIKVNLTSKRALPFKATPLCASMAPILLGVLAWMLAMPSSAAAQDLQAGFDNVAARAAAARDQQNVPLALELYGEAERLKPDWAEGWWYLGLLHYGDNDYAAAIDAFNHFLELTPDTGPATALRGLCEFETGAYDDSLRDIERGLALGAASQPRNGQILRYHLAQLLTRAGRFEDALKAYEPFARQHISDPDMLVGLGLAGMRVQALPKDISQDQRAMYMAVGECGYAFMSGDSEGAAGMFAQQFTSYPTAANLHLFYGYLLYPHDPDLATEEFRREVEIAPTNTPARAILAFTLMLQGRYNEALPEAQRVVNEAPALEIAQIALGRSLAETGDAARGATLLNAVLQHDPNNLEAHIALAATYARTGRREDAWHERMVCLELAK